MSKYEDPWKKEVFYLKLASGGRTSQTVSNIVLYCDEKFKFHGQTSVHKAKKAPIENLMSPN